MPRDIEVQILNHDLRHLNNGPEAKCLLLVLEQTKRTAGKIVELDLRHQVHQSAILSTPSNSNRSRFMQNNSTPESTAAALAMRTQTRNQAIAAAAAESTTGAATVSSASSFPPPQPAGTRLGGGFTPKPSTNIIRRSISNMDTASMDLEDDNDVDMDRASNRGETTPTTSHIPQNMSSVKRQEGLNRVSIDEEGSPRKRARGSEVEDHWDAPEVGHPVRASSRRARPLFPEYAQASEPESPSRSSTAQVEAMLIQAPGGIANASSSGPSNSRHTTIMGPPPTTPGGPKTPSSTHVTTDSHIFNLEALIEHLRLLERRRTAAERQSEIRQNRIQQLDEENKRLRLQVEDLISEVRDLKLERDEQHAKLESDEDRIVELLNDIRRLKGKTS
ncbi:hypothetical protein FS837_002536 [Tulasnella sp. UAMH 9824]|nr:hypothetical protein FS837_002536 [Tulasnella sp. UAMH 9824]